MIKGSRSTSVSIRYNNDLTVLKASLSGKNISAARIRNDMPTRRKASSFMFIYHRPAAIPPDAIKISTVSANSIAETATQANRYETVSAHDL